MSVDLVMSCYKDSLDWLEPLREKYPEAKVWLYDKWDGGGGPLLLPISPISPERIPNVGKADHTYLHHICERWGNLADWTLFSTDCPHGDLPAGFRMEAGLIPGPNVICPWVCRVRDWGPDGRIRWADFGNRQDRNGTNWAERWASGKIKPAALSFVEWSKRYVGYDPNGDWPGYHPGVVFAAPRDAITYLPRAFYERLMEQLSHHREPEEGHYLERLWLAILAGKARFTEEPV